MIVKAKYISLRRVLVFLALFSFFRPTVLEKFTITNTFFNILLIVSLIAILLDWIGKRGKTFDAFLILTLCFYIVMIISTINGNGSISRMAEYSLIGFSTFVLAQYIAKFELIYSTRIMRGFAWTYMILNIASILFFPNGITQTGNQQAPVFLLGQSTRYAYFYIPSLLFCCIGDLYAVGRIRTNTIALYICCLLSLIVQWSVGSALALLLLVLFYFFNDRKVFNPFVYYAVQLVGFFGLTFFSIQDKLASLIVNTLKKDLTLSSRTVIWGSAIRSIGTSPITGIGILENEQMHNMFGFVHVHNHLLQVMFQCGVIGFVIFALMIFVSYCRLNKKRTMHLARMIAFFIFIVGIQLLVDTVDGVRNHYLFMIALGASFRYFPPLGVQHSHLK